jgi:hypothetical protein
MNYAAYQRQKANNSMKIIGFKAGQDASQVTLKAQARASIVDLTGVGSNYTMVRNGNSSKPSITGIPTSFSAVGGTVANIMHGTPRTSNPTTAEAAASEAASAACMGGYSGVSGNLGQTGGYKIADGTQNILLSAQGAAVCSDAPSSAPYVTIIPCVSTLSTMVQIPLPPQSKCCVKDMGRLFIDNKDVVKDQGLAAGLRRANNLPNKLQGLRGPLMVGQ